MEITYLTHCLPIIKSPVNYLIMQNFDGVNVLGIRVAVGIRPNENWCSRLIAYTIRSICASRFLQNVFSFTPSIESRDSKLHKNCAEVEIKAFSG